MQFIKNHSALPVPRIFAYALDENNPAAVAYLLIEVLPGIVAMDALGGYKAHRGIGGPFDTAAEIFEAWTDNVKFKRDKETIEQMMQRGPISAERRIAIINQFSSQIEAMADRLFTRNHGPFPLYHDGFLHRNIMVLFEFLDFLQAIPLSFDLPQEYDRNGQPLDEELGQRWHEQREYIEMVKAAGLEDNLLSTCLSSNRSQALAYAYGAFTSIGKLGFYDRVVEELEKES
ncbi:hypothetical protein N0V88_004173 [Collariella sp. IMI 366227]|nr:hypothetical protein N0V88_004173 [Collariella sp. IMI 366227]